MQKNGVSRYQDYSHQVFNYYAMMRAGYLQQSPCIPNGHDTTGYRYQTDGYHPQGIIVSRSWKTLDQVHPLWRRDNDRSMQSNLITGALHSGDLRPIVFSDVDFAVMGRDAQGHVDQYVVDRISLESLGFVAHHYGELTDRSKHLDEIKTGSSSENCLHVGQLLFHLSLRRIVDSNPSFIRDNFKGTFLDLLNKSPRELTNSDFMQVLGNTDDPFYQLVINSLGEYLTTNNQNGMHKSDPHSGINRMQLIYTSIAAFSHSVMDEDEKIRQRLFGDFSAQEHLYPGVKDFFHHLTAQNIDVVAITRGSQFPYMDNSSSGMNDLFSRVYSTMVASQRSKPTRDPLHPEKKIRSYSLLVDNMTTTDKVRIIMHETLEQFHRAGLMFNNEQELINGISTYLDHCLFITDSDLEVWGSLPIIAVEALRTPSPEAVSKMYSSSQNIPQPVLIVGPNGFKSASNGFRNSSFSTDFSPGHPEIGRLLDDVIHARAIEPVHRF